MGKIAFVFAGQGAQYTGMGKELYENFNAARAVFDLAETMRKGTIQQCFEAPKEVLSQTINTQPCLYCVDLAAAEVLRSEGIIPSAVAGFSLGEIAALTFAGTFLPQDGFAFVCKRAQAMHAAASEVDSAMIAVLNLDNEAVERTAKKYDNVYPVNYNCPGQLVVSGLQASIDLFKKEIQSLGGRVMSLAVSGGFHSPFMDEAARQLESIISNCDLSVPKIPVYANISGMPYGNDTARNVIEQINHPVQWHKTILEMNNNGVDTFIEVGPGKVLSNLIKRITPDAKTFQVQDKQTLEQTLNNI